MAAPAPKKRGLAPAALAKQRQLDRFKGAPRPKVTEKDVAQVRADAKRDAPKKKRGLLGDITHAVGDAVGAGGDVLQGAYGRPDHKVDIKAAEARSRADLARRQRMSPAQQRAADAKILEHQRAHPEGDGSHHGGPLTASVFGISGPSRTAKNIGVAFKEDPGGTTMATLRGGRNTVYALPATLAATVTTRPDKTLKQIVKSYEEGYGGTDAEQVARFKKEGVFDKLLDATGAAAIGGATLGRILTPAAKAGQLGAKAEKLANTTRPALRVTGGVAKEQELSPNLFKAALQVKRDRVRAKADAKAVSRAHTDEMHPADVVRAQAQRANTKAGELVEVTPRFSSTARRGQRVGIAKLKTRAVHGLRAEQGQRIHHFAQQAINGLSKQERDAFYYAATGRVATDPSKFASHAAFEAAVRDDLEQIRAGIIKHRQANAIPAPTGVARRTDELAKLDSILKAPTAHFTQRLAETVRGLHNQDIEVGRGDPRLTAAQRLHRRYSQVAEDLGLMPDAGEGTAAYIKRVQKEADAKGRERPLYFPSEKYAMDLQPDYAAHAVGGARATKLPFQYTGKLMRAGLQDTSPKVYTTGLARSIKAKHNWNLIADQFDAHTFKDLRNMPVSQLKSELQRRNIDPNSVAFWHPGVFRRERAAADENRFGNLEAGDRRFDAVSNDEEAGLENLGASLKGATAANDKELVAAASRSPELTNGWSVVPKGTYNEIMAAAQPSGKVGRSWDIFRSKQARLMLGAGNLPWLQFQVASNTALGAVGTKGAILPLLAKQHAWYHGLTPAEREAVDMWTGSGRVADTTTPKMGATANGDFINGYRAFKANPVWDAKIAGKGPSTRQLNPIEAMFMMDRSQNTAFRRAMLYDVMKKDAFKRMGENMTAAQKLQARITGILKLAPEDQMREILANPKLMEKHAEHVNDWLGDWTTYTNAERKIFSRIPMFYGFLRFSTKLLFYTLPVKHPLISLTWAKLGQLQADELRKLGVSGLPWSRGKLYFGADGKQHRQELGPAMVRDGKVTQMQLPAVGVGTDGLKSVDLVRANPALNQLTGIKAPQQILSVAPPVISALVDQAFSRNMYMNRGWRVGGNPTDKNADWHDYGLLTRAKIFGDDLATMAYPYRLGEAVTQYGPQGDDSTLLKPAPTKYKRADIVKSINKDIARQKAEPHRVLKQIFPFIPREDHDPEAAAEMSARDKKKPKKATKRFGSGSGRSGGFGSGGGSSSGFGGG